MKFYVPDHIMRWAGPAVISVVGIGIIVGNPISQATLCVNTGNCLSTWIGALSGWAALAGALLTLGVMREQLLEQRRQTDHIKGESLPEIFLERSFWEASDTYYAEVKVSVVNRNRRPLSLHELEAKFDDPSLAVGIRMSSVGMENVELPLSDFLPMKHIHRTLPG